MDVGRKRLVGLALLVLCASSCTASDALPAFDAPVVDAAGALSNSAKTELGAELEAFRTETGPQIAVLTVESTGGASIEDYAIDVARAWGVGDRERDDGVLLLLVTGDRELRIEVGSGVEGDLTDLESGRIIDLAMVPLLQAGDTDGAVRAGVAALMLELSGGTYEPPSMAVGSATGASTGGLVFAILVAAFIVMAFIVVSTLGRRRGWVVSSGSSSGSSVGSRTSGGFSGGGGGGFSGGGASGKW
ncbi:MAG: TPM domain-containing protein [Acidobacteria bacterium]|nr:TPM domain-containing protein [Acidobacteriota bacterium]